MSDKARVFSIPAGIPFLRTLAHALMDGSLVGGFAYNADDPLSLANVTIYVPTRRAVRALRSEFVDLIGKASAILPTISALGETEEDQDYFDSDRDDSLDLLPPISSLDRLIELARLILAWRNKLPDMIVELHSGSPLVAPASPADAIWLARSLAELVSAIETEEGDWSALAAIDHSDHALWWQLTTEFLKIASTFWPQRLEELGKSSPARHSSRLLTHQAARIKQGRMNGPIIVAGSTGSVPATAKLIATVARYASGAVVLGGLDRAMSEADFNLAGGRGGGVGGADSALDLRPASRSHPQYGLYHLLKRLGVGRDDVADLGMAAPDIELRSRVLSVAMAPSEATSGWTQWRQSIPDKDMREAFGDVSLIEAANERIEATAIAVALKLAVSPEPGEACERQAALITPDRNLARRVGVELARFGIEADDSAGTPLLSSPQGSLTHLALEAILRPGDPVALMGLLKHPLLRLGLQPDDLSVAVHALELIAFRGGALRGGLEEINISMLTPLFEEALARQTGDRHTPHWRRALSEAAKQQARDIAGKIGKAVEPLAAAIVRRDGVGLGNDFTLGEWAERTGRVLEALAMDDQDNLAALWSDEAGNALAGLLKGLMESEAGLLADGPQWIDVMTALMAGEGVKPKAMGHPRIFIWGTLEARLQSVDTIILGGLNEGVWPGLAANNPFLSRMMKTTIGLEPPERRIGQNAHDFMMAMATRNLVLTRALRQGSTPTVASRFLQRSLAMTGESVASQMKDRGRAYLDMTEAMDQGGFSPPPGRPEPRPPSALQPVKYTFSEVSRLRRDPYAIYAKRILRLDPVMTFNGDPGPSERGILYHAILERFIAAGHIARTDSGKQAMTDIANAVFDQANLPIHIDALWRPRFMEVAKAFLASETKRRDLVEKSHTEVGASFALNDQLRLTGVADRIDLMKDGSVDLIDYKTGSSPSLKEARALLDPQLALEAAALSAGAFKAMGQRDAQNLTYVRLKPAAGFKAENVNNQDPAKPDDASKKTAMQLAQDAIGQFAKLVGDLKSGKYGFISRLTPAQQRDYGGDFDHLARVAEWTTAEDGDEEEDGDE